MNTMCAERVLATGQRLQIVQGDITRETSEAIVNAANEHLQHGAGVAGAIVRRGGPVIQQESDEWIHAHGPVSHAHPAWTSGGLLAAKFVIHAVGPVWGEGGEDDKLSAAVHGSLEVADQLKLTSLSLPALSTGIFGFPRERAAEIILRTIQSYFARHPSGVQSVRLVLFDEDTLQAFISAWQA